MDRKILILLALAVTASGCADGNTQSIPGDGSQQSGESLEVVEFDVSDTSMTPRQQARVTLKLRNHNKGDIKIEDISLYNTAFLSVGDKSCSPEEIQPAREDFTPGMECSWTVTAPEDMRGQDSRSVTVQLNLKYDSELSNRESPMKVDFDELEDIEERREHSETFSNGEVEVKVSYQDPMSMEGDVINFEIDSLGAGNVPSNYNMEYEPEGVFDDCQTEVEPVVEDEASFSCKIGPDADSPLTRNLVFSTSYKYVKSPSLDIEVVKP